jgi:CHAT domain-containing protein/tetratricopeptide (TPR) repeat protein
MVKRIVLLFSLLGLIFLGISTQSKKTESKDSKGVVLKKKTTEPKEDKLLEWMSFMRRESASHRNQGDIIRAIEILTKCIDKRWREPISNEEYESLAWVYTNRAYLYNERLGDFLAAKDDYLSALKQFELCEPSDYLVARYVYEPLGNIYTRFGENEIAVSMLEKFKRVCEENGEKEALMNSYNDLARTYINTAEFEKAIELFSAGIALDDSDLLNLGLLYSGKSQVELEINRYDESLTSSSKSIDYLLKVIRDTDLTDYRNGLAKKYLTSSLSFKAKILGQEDLNGAHELYLEALELCQEIYPEKHRARGRALIQLGDSYNALGLKLKAMDYYQLGLHAMVDTLEIDNLSMNPSKSQLYANVGLGEALILKGKVAHELFKESGEKPWLHVSVQAYLSYFEWAEIQRTEQFEFDAKLETAKEMHLTGESTLNAMFDLYKETKDRKVIDRAFVLMDQTKAIVLAEERGFKDLANNNPKMRGLLMEQNTLKFQRAIFKSDIQSAEKENAVDDVLRLKKRLGEIDEQSQLLDQEIRSLFPAYRMQTSSTLEGKVANRLSEKLKERNAKVLSYFVGEEWVYIITGAPSRFEFSQISREGLEGAVEEFLSELNSPNTSTPEKYAASGKKLFDILIGNRSNRLGSNWVIFPDGILNSLPFEALVSNSSKSSNSFKKMEYLVRDHIIQYSPSAYFFAHDELGEKAEKSFLGIAPVFKNSKSYDFLPKSIEELQTGAVLFSGAELIEGEATKSHFFRDAADYDILHISTHAGRNSGDNNDAWMVFSDAKSTDSRLIATELLKLDLPASLVVLNACETGSGTVFKGEGPMSLARGFLDAGSQSTVTNLWRVNHESNALIMKSFYEKLSETQSPSGSLNAAKLDYLSNSEIDEASAHPYFWSSAILIGTDVSVVSPSSSSMFLWIMIALGSVLILALGLLWNRKKRKAVNAI